MPYLRVSHRMTLSDLILSDLAKYSMTRSTRGLSARTELLVIIIIIMRNFLKWPK